MVPPVGSHFALPQISRSADLSPHLPPVKRGIRTVQLLPSALANDARRPLRFA